MSLTPAQKELLEAAKVAARELPGNSGKALVPLIGELTVCDLLDLEWAPSDGFDARKDESRWQIKSRKSWSTPKVNPKGRIGRFGRKRGYDFDVAVYIELDHDFEPAGIWRMGREQVSQLEGRAGGRPRGLHVGEFTGPAEQLPRMG